MEMPPMTDRRALMIGSLAALASPALAQARPVRLIVPFPPGGAVDLLGRILAERLGPTLGTGVVVENRGGAGGLIGADAVAKGDKDGTVLGLVSVTILCAFPFMTARMPFNPRTDLAPVSQITDGALLCVVNAETARRRGWSDFRALVQWARANPDGVKMGSSGSGTSSHINIEAINRFATRGSCTCPTGAAAGHQRPAGRQHRHDVRRDAGADAARGERALPGLRRQLECAAPAAAEVPGMRDFAELGLGQHNVSTWNAVMAPGGTPPELIARHHAALRPWPAMPDFVERLKPLGYGTVVSDTPAALTALIERETPHWRQLVEISGARLE
jgi:tripartite-type tricarboxylate transporter receptor subunit TctC